MYGACAVVVCSCFFCHASLRLQRRPPRLGLLRSAPCPAQSARLGIFVGERCGGSRVYSVESSRLRSPSSACARLVLTPLRTSGLSLLGVSLLRIAYRDWHYMVMHFLESTIVITHHASKTVPCRRYRPLLDRDRRRSISPTSTCVAFVTLRE